MGLLRDTLAEADGITENVRQWPRLFGDAATGSDRLTGAVEKGQLATAAPPGVGLLVNPAGQPLAPTTAPGTGGGRSASDGGGGIRTRNISLGGAPVIEGDDWYYENIGGVLYRVARVRGPSSSSSGGGGSGGGSRPRRPDGPYSIAHVDFDRPFIPAGGNVLGGGKSASELTRDGVEITGELRRVGRLLEVSIALQVNAQRPGSIARTQR